jgi:hypothetical protein
MTDPNAELVDQPILGTKPVGQDPESGKLPVLSDEASPLTPFDVIISVLPMPPTICDSFYGFPFTGGKRKK